MANDKPDPETTTLYRIYDSGGVLLYVGISTLPLRRLGQHARGKPWWRDAAQVTVEHFDARAAALQAEGEAIIAEQPKYNVAGKRAGQQGQVEKKYKRRGASSQKTSAAQRREPKDLDIVAVAADIDAIDRRDRQHLNEGDLVNIDQAAAMLGIVKQTLMSQMCRDKAQERKGEPVRYPVPLPDEGSGATARWHHSRIVEYRAVKDQRQRARRNSLASRYDKYRGRAVPIDDLKLSPMQADTLRRASCGEISYEAPRPNLRGGTTNERYDIGGKSVTNAAQVLRHFQLIAIMTVPQEHAGMPTPVTITKLGRIALAIADRDKERWWEETHMPQIRRPRITVNRVDETTPAALVS